MALFMCGALSAAGALPFAEVATRFIEERCSSCHDEEEKKGGQDLTALRFAPENPNNFATWVKVYDMVKEGKMPPKERRQPPPEELAEFVGGLAHELTATEHKVFRPEGRAVQRRLNRYEYENALRDLLHAPWLQIRDRLPEDGERYRFNKVGDALDISYVNLGRYLAVAEDALRRVIARELEPVPSAVVRYYAREQRTFAGRMTYSVFITTPERATFPVLDATGQPEVRSTKLPITVGASDPATRNREAMGMVSSHYEPIEPRFDQFKAPVGGCYKLRFCGYSIWVGPGKEKPGKPFQWWIPNLDEVSRSQRSEPVALFAEVPGQQLRRLGAFDFAPDPTVAALDVVLSEGETIRPDAVRLFRSRPPTWVNPLATTEGQPGVAYCWLEVEGPLPDEGAERLLRNFGAGRSVPEGEAERLLRDFIQRAYRRPAQEDDFRQFLSVIERARSAGDSFADAMIAGYTAVLCSPEFLYVDEKPGLLDDTAIATRLALFLWNAPPDPELLRVAQTEGFRRPEILRREVDRLLDDARARRFIDAFLDYWLDLRRIQATAPDSALYSDYYLDDALVDAALDETRLFFAEVVRRDLPVRTLVDADFAFLNERLAAHYGLSPIDGVGLRRVTLPSGSVRGGLLTQASILKVTANGTTTSPVLRGAWIMERILGIPPSPPPPGIPSIEPDTRGATTIRQLLDKHRQEETCATCHAKIDPVGFALESFDVLGGWRTNYRAVGGDVAPAVGIGKNGQKFAFHFAQPVDSSGELWDGRSFGGIRDLKKLLVGDQQQLARNLAQQFIIVATGASVGFGDRPAVEAILDRARPQNFGVRSLIHEVVQSDLFLSK